MNLVGISVPHLKISLFESYYSTYEMKSKALFSIFFDFFFLFPAFAFFLLFISDYDKIEKSEDVSVKTVYQKSKRRTLSIQIGKNGSVIVKMPTWLSKQEADRFVASKMPWILKNIAKLDAVREQATPFTDEEKAAILRVADEKIPAAVEQYAERMGVSYGKIRIKYLRTKWGSCKNDGTLTFNALLGAVPTPVLDYVVVHELAHRKEMNHSKKFYGEIAKILPSYKEAQGWFRKNGRVLILRAFPIAGEKEFL